MPQIAFRRRYRNMAVSPDANNSVSSLTNRSRSRRTIVPSSSISSERSITFTAFQAATCRDSPDPNTPSNMPLTAHIANVTGM
jgi:hypothetical protein